MTLVLMNFMLFAKNMAAVIVVEVMHETTNAMGAETHLINPRALMARWFVTRVEPRVLVKTNLLSVVRVRGVEV